MSSLNKASIIGRLGNDPETRYLTDGTAVCNLSVATSETWKDKTSGEKQEKTEWHRVTMFARLAEIAAQYLKKGSLVYIEGRIETRKWQDKDGVERYTTEIKANEMKMLSSGQQGNQAPQQEAPKPAKAHSQVSNPAGDFDDDIPF
jgi:single-strand DNA-binding protein